MRDSSVNSGRRGSRIDGQRQTRNDAVGRGHGAGMRREEAGLEVASGPQGCTAIYTDAMWRTVLILCLTASGPAGAQSSAAKSSDEAAVRTVVRRYVDARELRDPAAIETLFTADADQHTTSGEWRRGRAEVSRGAIESSKRNPGKRTIAVETVRFITADVAIADGPYEITTDGNLRRMWTTIVLERERGTWRIAAIRNMVPATNPAEPSR